MYLTKQQHLYKLARVVICGIVWWTSLVRRRLFWRWFNWGMQSVLGRTVVCVNNRISPSLRTADVSPRSSLLSDASRGGTSATQRQKFHTDDVNQCLLNKSGSHGVPNANLFNFTFSWSILEKCCVYLLMSSNKTQMLLLEKTIFYKYWLFC